MDKVMLLTNLGDHELTSDDALKIMKDKVKDPAGFSRVNESYIRNRAIYGFCTVEEYFDLELNKRHIQPMELTL